MINKAEKRCGRLTAIFLVMVLVIGSLSLSGCGIQNKESKSDPNTSTLGSGSRTLRILSGSENKELESILEKYADKHGLTIVMTYKGSLDIMRALQQEDFDYDAVWPASSIWMNAGDTMHRIKHAESISINPVVFGIRKSLAKDLGFVGKDVSISDILDAIMAGKLTFCMTSATQFNSGASAYLGFISALAGSPDVISQKDLENEEVRQKLTDLLSGIDRSSGSSDWLKDMFVAGDYDAMVNYECLMIAANKELEKEGKEPLYVVYPTDGLAVADSPLAYVDRGNDKEEKIFLDFQQYLLSDDAQDQIQKTGRRSAYVGINEDNKDVFRSDWGLQPDKVLSSIKMPDTGVVTEALNLYQSELRKPSLSVYCLDFSGSMYGEGSQQLKAAMQQLLIQKIARENFLQASERGVTIVIPFSSDVMDVWKAEGNGADLEALYDKIDNLETNGGTDMYAAITEGIKQMSSYDLSQYTPAVIVMTDGASQNGFRDFSETYRADRDTVPVFSIMYSDADPKQLDQLAELTNARVFDGRNDLTGAFRQVRGYN